ncbi:MAG TPA: hypothetical protein VFL85_00715 [Candidatus Saccharimonadales bacterium]|nr:hypothetical protein [Candidatus Saccharimonadales bacterium]
MSFRSHEGATGHESATPDALSILYNKMIDWLVPYGEHIPSSGREINRTESGLSVYYVHSGKPYFHEELYARTFSREEVRQLSPRAADVFDIQGEVHFSYSPAHLEWSDEGDGSDVLRFYKALCGVVVEKTSDNSELSMSIEVDERSNGVAVTGNKLKHRGAANVLPGDGPTREKRDELFDRAVVDNLMEFLRSETQITKAECAALDEIFTALGQLK